MTTTPDLFDWLAKPKPIPAPPVPVVSDNGRPTAPFFDMAWQFGKAQKKSVSFADSLAFLGLERTGQAQFLQVKVVDGGYECLYRERILM